MKRSALLHVLVGSSPASTEDPSHTLVVEAEPERIEALRHNLSAEQGDDERVIQQALLASASGIELLWFRFSDSRFNGLIPLERWRAFYPNLQLLHEETLHSQTLAQILAQWPAANDGDPEISLTLSQGDPVEVLKGAGAWLQRLHRIELRGPKAEHLWLASCGSWLEQQGFERESESSLSWTLDARSRQLMQKQAEIDDLSRQLLAITQEKQKELEASKESYTQAFKVMSLIFPYAAYRKKRPELNQLSDPDLLAHYIDHGMLEGVNLDFSSLKSEWEERCSDHPEEVSFLPLLRSQENLSLATRQQNDPEPIHPLLTPIEDTEINAWLAGSTLYLSVPDELATTIRPAIYKGSQGFALQRRDWSEDILKQLSGQRSFRLFNTENRNHLKILTDTRDSSVLDAGMNHIPYCSVIGGQTLHVHLSEAEQSFELPLLEGFEIDCESNETWAFETLLAVHRAQGSLEIITTHNGKAKSHCIEFDPGKTGGTAPVNYLRVNLEFSLEKGTTALTLNIKHHQFVSEIEGRNDSYYFIANPILRCCGPAKSEEKKLDPRLLKPEQDVRTSDVLFSSVITPFGSADDHGLVLSLGNGSFHHLFSPLDTVINLEGDYSHTLIVNANPSGDIALFINGTFCELIAISGGATPVPLPLHWLRGEPVDVELRDPSGSQIFLSHPMLAPRFLTPVEVLLQEAKPPFPTNLTVRANHRYQALRNHLRQPMEGLQPQMLIRALQTLDRDYNTLKLLPLEFPVVSEPDVSVIIPAHNKIEATYYALSALLLAHNNVRFEIILVDDGSTDETAAIEELVQGIRVIRNEQPLRFIKACNRGVSESRGKFVVLLNNDTEVTVGWLDALVEAFQRFDNVGAVGAKLLYPDGRLQDAGGIVWSSGNPWNYGNGMNPWDPRFCYARQVDYLSGAALMTTREIWDEVGGLSQYLEPMYFEDTDFSFKVREAGYKTYFIPSSIVYHFEGTTSGTDTSAGFKKFQEINRPKFKRCWAKAFSRHGEEGVQADLEKDRGITGRILFIDYTTPREDRDAGSYAAIREIELVQSMGYKVTFLPQNLSYFGEYTEELMRNGVEVITSPFTLSLASFLVHRANEFDAAYITRYYVAAETVDFIREHSPKTRILLNNADLHFLRELRTALIDNDEARLEGMRIIRQQELEMMRRVDLVLSYNEVEHAVITSHTDGQVKVMTCPWVVDLPTHVTPLSERKGLAFLGSFNHPPNVEGIKWFCRDVMPLLEGEELSLTIYGSGMNQDIKDLASDWIDPLGYIEDVADAYQRHRVFVAPLLSGAGMKGKVVSALAYGIPTVLTPTAAEGIGLRHGYDCIIARKPEEWVSAITQLCNNDDLWHAISVASRTYAASHFSFAAGKQKMKAAFEAVDLYSHMDD
jgi:GT2 family glycosyltransferase/glycosyltransferase involved in cell wall biosynthesis